MCGWEEALFYAAAAAAAAGGTYMSADAQNEAADRQAAALNAAMEQQDQYNRKAEGKALENADEYTAQNRTDRFNEARDTAAESLAQTLVKSREEAGTPAQATGRVSQDYTADNSSKMATEFQKAVDNARLMGKMRGVQDMLGNEGVMNADYASQLNTISRNAKGAYDAAQPGIQLAGKVDAGQMAAGSLLQSVGTSALGSGLGKAFSGTTTGADVGNGVGNANISSQSTTGLTANAKTGLMGSIDTSSMFPSTSMYVW